MAGSVTIEVRSNLLGQIPARLRASVDAQLTAIGEDGEEALKQSLEGPRSGRIYKRGSGTHQASAPGEAPATDIGTLANSIQHRRLRPLQHEVAIGAEYAAALEFGTGRMAARPFVRPWIESDLKPALEAIEAELA